MPGLRKHIVRSNPSGIFCLWKRRIKIGSFFWFCYMSGYHILTVSKRPETGKCHLKRIDGARRKIE